MSDSNEHLPLIDVQLDQPEVPANNLFSPMSPAASYGRNGKDSGVGTFAYLGTRYGGTSVANGSFSLTASQTRYMSVHRGTGAVVDSTTIGDHWDNTINYGRAYKIVTDGSNNATWEDHRFGPYGIHSSPGRYINNTPVGNVGTGEDDLMSATLVANLLNAAKKGIRIKAWGTAANNANTKTLRLKFGSATILTQVLTASQAGTWVIDAVVLSTGTDAQRYISHLLQGGTTTLLNVEQGTATQDDGATITVKCTGDATSNDDIQQTGMVIEYLH